MATQHQITVGGSAKKAKALEKSYWTIARASRDVKGPVDSGNHGTPDSATLHPGYIFLFRHGLCRLG
jgi:hypothetical protein